jgi:hypothetical protein
VKKPNNVSVHQPQGQLTELAQQIVGHHEAAEAALRTCAEHAMAAGDLLITAQQQVTHGQWGEWVEHNCKMSLRPAQVYMRLAGSRAEIEAKAQSSAHLDLSIAGALKLISGPPRPANYKHTAAGGSSVSFPAAKPKHVTHCDLLGLWAFASADERRAFFDGIGLNAIVENIPEGWAERAIKQLSNRIKPQPKARKATAKKLAIPDDLSIPQFLKVAAPANGESNAPTP